MSDDRYQKGGFYRIDQRTGFRVRARDTVKEWDGTIVDRGDAESRHPQEFVRGRADKQSVPDPRPEPPDVFRGTGSALLVDDAGFGPVLRVAPDVGTPSIRIIVQAFPTPGADL